jgi:multiple sugar transport system ATP-binding protein
VEGAGEDLSVRFANGDTMTVPAESRQSYGRYAGKKMILGIRPEHLNAKPDDSGPIHVKVNVVEPLGQTTLVYFSLGDEYYAAHVDPRRSLAANAPLTLTPDPQGLHLIDPRTDNVINAVY